MVGIVPSADVEVLTLCEAAYKTKNGGSHEFLLACGLLKRLVCDRREDVEKCVVPEMEDCFLGGPLAPLSRFSLSGHSKFGTTPIRSDKVRWGVMRFNGTSKVSPV